MISNGAWSMGSYPLFAGLWATNGTCLTLRSVPARQAAEMLWRADLPLESSAQFDPGWSPALYKPEHFRMCRWRPRSKALDERHVRYANHGRGSRSSSAAYSI